MVDAVKILFDISIDDPADIQAIASLSQCLDRVERSLIFAKTARKVLKVLLVDGAHKHRGGSLGPYFPADQFSY